MWDYTRNGVEFFQSYIPFWEMEPMDELVTEGNYCLSKENEVYLVYLPYGGETKLNLEGADGTFSVSWYNPRSGGELIQAALTKVEGGSVAELGAAPQDSEKDWAILIQKLK